jgi:UDP-N-acetylmuramoylalanine-D-glutamate ligase
MIRADREASLLAPEGDNVLLGPARASMDQAWPCPERGELFAAAGRGLTPRER